VLKDLKRPKGVERPSWVKTMAARKRKTLAVCKQCHLDIHAGRSNRTPLMKLKILESWMPANGQVRFGVDSGALIWFLPSFWRKRHGSARFDFHLGGYPQSRQISRLAHLPAVQVRRYILQDGDSQNDILNAQGGAIRTPNRSLWNSGASFSYSRDE